MHTRDSSLAHARCRDGTTGTVCHVLAYGPGLALTGLLAWFSIWFSEWAGTHVLGLDKSPVSAVMVAIISGMLLGNLVMLPDALKPGLRLAMKTVLRLGIILLGVRLSLYDVFRLGALGVPVVMLSIAGTLLATTLFAGWMRLPARLGALIGVGTSICGVSAIVAAAPAIDAKDEEVTYAIAVITVFGLAAMALYPYLSYWALAGKAVQTGLFLGTAIHETAQVAGAGLVYADVFGTSEVLDTATVAKLVRNVFMAIVIPMTGLYYARRNACAAQGQMSMAGLFPVFVLGFLVAAAGRSYGDLGVATHGRAFGVWDHATWVRLCGLVGEWAVNLMVVALAGVGLSTRFQTLRVLGVKPFVVGLAAALAAGLISLTVISTLERWLAV